MGIKSFAKKAAIKSADAVAKLSVLSPEQLKSIEYKRMDYLSDLPRPNDEVAQILTERLLAAAGIDIYNEYLEQISNLYVPVERKVEYGEPFIPSFNIRYFNITKWVTDKNENSLEKLVNVYEVLSNENCNIALIFHRTMNKTDVYLGATNTLNAKDNVLVDNYQIRLKEAIKGNFPGSELSECAKGIIPFLKNTEKMSIACASNIPGEKSEKFISQSIEKLIDGIVPDTEEKEYTIILLATPIIDVENRKLHLAKLYSSLAPYAGWQTNYSYTQSDSTNSSATFGVNAGVSAGVQAGRNNSIANTKGKSQSASETSTDTKGTSSTDTTGSSMSDSTGNTSSSGTSHTDGTSEGNSIYGNVSAEGLKIGPVGISGSIGTEKSKGSSSTDTINSSLTSSTTKTITDTASKAVTDTVSNAVAKTLGNAINNSQTISNGTYNGANAGANFGANFARASNVSASVGKGEAITQTFTNYNIKHTLDVLEEQMKRLEQSTALGMWDFAAYILSEDSNVANNVAHSYLALTQGETSYLSKTAINLWRGDLGKASKDAEEICSYVKEFRHPLFGLNPNKLEENIDFNAYPSVVTATTTLSGKELSYSLNFPRKSIAGLPVIECVEFGRGVVTYNETSNGDSIHIGNIFHMNNKENTSVDLNLKSLDSHVFITGSTGSGKSNTVFKLLSEVQEKKIPFLVVEPAKGEYKNIFHDIASVYGTNPYLTPLLKLNPFSFPEGTHVFEHMDRLVEIFNVCWPMYAAMPAVLKSAIEKSYEDCGWDLVSSTNRYSNSIYPTFKDVARNIKLIINESEYDTENKGAYKGSLLTRLKSLTNGINGLVFASDELTNQQLFDENVIIDLSRVGSNETKSLIMGILVLKLQEYRMSKSNVMNSNLKHVTVLEEAHNLLKNVSSTQVLDTGNLAGKSVEMISNAIAEMRAYGEGFIIVDQAPGLLDKSTIRNTNTKIIMRLPDKTDRDLVGLAANLNEDQILELAKIPCGVGAIYQNEWIQPVLCKIDYYKTDSNVYSYTLRKNVDLTDKKKLENSLLDCIANKELFKELRLKDIRNLKNSILNSNIDSKIKVDLIEYINNVDNNEIINKLGKLIYDFLSADKALDKAMKCTDIDELRRTILNNLNPSIKSFTEIQINYMIMLILNVKSLEDSSFEDVLRKYKEVYWNIGGVA